MKYMQVTPLLILMFIMGCSTKKEQVVKVEKVQIMEVACGECMFDLPGDGCDLAVRIDGQAYFVEGTGIDDHGDAHAGDGFCNAIRLAEVKGELIDGKYHVSELKLLAHTPKD